jgi:Ca-activated chloride channel family protein
MLRFAHEEYLYLLISIPVMIGIAILVYYYKKRLLRSFGDFALMEKLSDTKSRYKYWIKAALIILSFVVLIVALANPRIGTRYEEVHREGVDIIVALDVSYSMKAEDLKPNRLEKAKHEFISLIGRLRGDRIGLIVFAGEAYMQLPLTIDYAAAQLLTEVVDENSAPVPGTSLQSAIELAIKSFPTDEDQQSGKVLILITDGEDHDKEAVKLAQEAASRGIVIYTIGVGSASGVPIPVYRGGRQIDFKKDMDDNVVMTKLDEVTLKEIAKIGNGKYYHSSNSGDELDLIYKDILQMEKKDLGMKQFTQFEDRFQYFVALGLLLLLIEFFLSERKWKWFSKINIFKA